MPKLYGGESEKTNGRDYKTDWKNLTQREDSMNEKMSVKERADLIYHSLCEGFEVCAKRNGGNIPLLLAGPYDGKCVAAVQNDDGSLRLLDVSNDTIIRMKCETICEAPTVSVENATVPNDAF